MTPTAEAETAWKSALARVRSFPTLPVIVNKVTDRMALQQGRLLRDAEGEVLRFTHDQTGEFLLMQWNPAAQIE